MTAAMQPSASPAGVILLPRLDSWMRVEGGAARSGRRTPSAPYARAAAPLLDGALPRGAAVEFQGEIRGLSDPLSFGCPDEVARLHLIDPETWKACREAQQAWSAFLPTLIAQQFFRPSVEVDNEKFEALGEEDISLRRHRLDRRGDDDVSGT